MPFTIEFDQALHAVRVVMSGDISAKEVADVFEAAYTGKYPPDVNAIWSFEGNVREVDVMQVFELAKFTQSKREIEGHPATAFIVYSSRAKMFCEEYKLLVKEAPYSVEIFTDVQSAESWLAEHRKSQA